MANFCPECGARVEGMKFCAECGHPVVGAETVAMATGSGTTAAEVAPELPPDNEREVWRGTPDPVLSPFAAKKTTYVLTNERLIVDHGLIGKKRDQLELYRVRDIRVKRSLPQRSRGRGDLWIYSADKSHPHLMLSSVESPDDLAETIRSLVKGARASLNLTTREEL